MWAGVPFIARTRFRLPSRYGAILGTARNKNRTFVFQENDNEAMPVPRHLDTSPDSGRNPDDEPFHFPFPFTKQGSPKSHVKDKQRTAPGVAPVRDSTLEVTQP
jgi:hypothetical protein